MAKSKLVDAAPPESIAEAMVTPFESVIKPIILVEGEPHPWQDMEKDGELPVITSVGYAKVSPHSRSYVSYVIKSQGPKVLSLEVSEPNKRLDSEIEAKISFSSVLVHMEDEF